MRCFINFSLTGFSNTYLVGPDGSGDAILIDPGEMNINLLNLIEDHGFYVRHILVTHTHQPHIRGIKTLLKIYNAKIYSALENVLGFPAVRVRAGQKINLSGFDVEILEFSGHSLDSLVYKVGSMLFTGDTLSAGHLGHDEDPNTIKVMRDSVSTKIKKLDDNLLIFPGHGPPSTIRAEKDFNPELH